jgi:putative ABC transport system substrate-binding protein
VRLAGIRAAIIAGAVAVAPGVADAQESKTWRVGYLSASTLSVDEVRKASPFDVFRKRMSELGYVEGRNLAFEIRTVATSPGGLAGAATELVRRPVDVIVAPTNASVAAARKATSSIPIVMWGTTDPVGLGFVASLARPGGNVTGLTMQTTELNGRALQLLKDVVPGLSRVAVLWDPANYTRSPRDIEAAIASLGLTMLPIEVRKPEELEAAFDAAVRGKAGAVLTSGPWYAQRERIAKLAIDRRLPIIAPVVEYAEGGYLMAYGASIVDQQRQAADFVARILKGAKPADIPVEQPREFVLAINQKTARSLGLPIPPRVALQATRTFD